MVRIVSETGPEKTIVRHRAVKIGAACVSLILLLAVGYWLGAHSHGGGSVSPTPDGSVSAASSAGVPGESGSSGKSGGPFPEHFMVMGEVEPGLWRGTATVSTGNHKEIYGIRYGWDWTIDGSIGAAMNYSIAGRTLAGLIESTATELYPKLYTSSESILHSEWWKTYRKNMREQNRLTDDGVLLDASGSGKPSTEEKFYGGGIPQYGLYRVAAVEHAESGKPLRVTVEVLLPRFSGPGTDTNLSQVALTLDQFKWIMLWDGDDWKIEDGGLHAYEGMKASNPGWEFLHKIAGDGWAVPADGTQKPIPGAVLTQ